MSTPLLEVSRLLMKFQGITALDTVSFTMAPGSITSLIGPNGAGKTTMFNCITGMYQPTSGQVLFDGIDITPEKAHEISRHGIARTFQNLALFGGLTVLENMLVGAYRQGSSGLLQGAFLSPKARREQQAAGWLSGGEQQMLALGRALVSGPKLLLVDELSLGLAPLIVQAIYKQLRVVAQTMGTSMLVVEQNARLALEFAATAYVLDRGRIVLSGPAAEVAASDAMHESYLGARRDAAPVAEASA